MDSQPKPVRFHYTRSSEYRVVHANGAWLFPATNSMISLDFFVEQLASPDDSISEFDGTQWLPERPVVEPQQAIAIREAQVGLFINPSTARSIAYLLLAKAEELEPQIPLEPVESNENE